MSPSAPAPAATSDVVITPEQLRARWQENRRLTRRVIEAFPERELFEYAVGGMRPFATLVLEFIGMAVPSLQGIVTRAWPSTGAAAPAPTTKAELLARWDEATAEIDRLWPSIPPGRFQEHDVAFGQWPGPVWGLMMYLIENENHHRGQGYVYLRTLGIEPPAFWQRD